MISRLALLLALVMGSCVSPSSPAEPSGEAVATRTSPAAAPAARPEIRYYEIADT